MKFEIWDTAGQERYHSLAPMYYRGAQAAIVVYDITNTVSHMTSAKTLKVTCLELGCRSPLFCFNVMFGIAFSASKDTFTRAKNWVKELQRQASPNIVIALAGNKADLANKRAVDHQVTSSSHGQILVTTNCQLRLLLSSFVRKRKRMQTTTVCSSWKLRPRRP